MHHVIKVSRFSGWACQANWRGRRQQLPSERGIRFNKFFFCKAHRILFVLPGAIPGHYLHHQIKKEAFVLRFQFDIAVHFDQRNRYVINLIIFLPYWNLFFKTSIQFKLALKLIKLLDKRYGAYVRYSYVYVSNL